MTDQKTQPLALPISVFIIACNEADRIARTIESVRDLTDDIVVIDSGSTDGTREIATSLGARTIHNPWPGYGPQKKFAENHCRHEWILNLDADEVATPRLIGEIRALFSQGKPSKEAYLIRIVEVFPGDDRPRFRAHSHNYVRFYHKDAGSFSTSPVHDVVQLHSGVAAGQLKGIIHHFSMRGIGEQITKFNKYSDDLVENLHPANKRIATWRVFTEFPMAFLKAYLIRLHILRGTYGFLVATNYAIFRHLRVAKHYERRKTRARHVNRRPKAGRMPERP